MAKPKPTWSGSERLRPLLTLTDTLTLDPLNARDHGERSIDAIAASLRKFGQRKPIVVDTTGKVIAGNGTLTAARRLGWTHLATTDVDGMTEDEARAFAHVDNRTAELSTWNVERLAIDLPELRLALPDLDLGWTAKEIRQVEVKGHKRNVGTDDVPDAPTVPTSKLGDVWLCGRHRVMCGDSTDAQAMARLMNGEQAALVHADPPYGMGKESDGVMNDNLYRDALDDFQMRWWSTVRPHVVGNASTYLWGNAADLWRLWLGRLERSELLVFCNEIVWSKGAGGLGVADPGLTSFAVNSERCLFFQLGRQTQGAVNNIDFPESRAPLLAYFVDEAAACKLTPADVKRLCGVSMFGHWFSRAQFVLMPEAHYLTMSTAYPGQFMRPWAKLKAEWSSTVDSLSSALRASRSFFDNTHDTMRDVWEFPRVHGDERHGHATPKPVAMIERVMRSSLAPGGLCVEPFAGSGSTMIAAEATGRRCFTMELSPAYVDVTVRRWEAMTGQTATLEQPGPSS